MNENMDVESEELVMVYPVEDYRLPTDYQNFIAASRYSRWIVEENRREIWPEPVARYVDNVVKPALIQSNKLSKKSIKDLCLETFRSIASAKTMPSMRALMAAGEALDRDLMAGYNCSFISIDHPRAFDEILYILTCGTGVGFSCEQKSVNKLPEVAESLHHTDTTIVVSDSRIGWASSFRELLSLLWSGKIPLIDVSRVRPKGARLKVFGGRASGPEPLVDLFNHCIRTFKAAAGRKLSTIEVHSIVCKIGEIVVVGGVRRSALISLSDLNDAKMRGAKNGAWWERNPEFALANNSAVYEEKPDVGVFLEEWKSLYDSKSGERGIFNRDGVRRKIALQGKRDGDLVVGTNPCSEISLRSCGLCNLTEVVIRSDDTFESLKAKVGIAAMLGTIQSSLTDFRYVRNIWKRNAEEERLLGVSLTGIYDNVMMSNLENSELDKILQDLTEYANVVNAEWANILDINPSCAITAVKPSGTVSQLVNSASGIHPRHSEYYIRSVRGDNKDPMTNFLKDQGIPFEPCVMKPETTTIFYFPMKAPDGSLTRDDVSALDHLNMWAKYNKHWAEHQVSITVNVREHEWVDVAAWVYKNFDEITGISFLPHDGGSYKQAPYQECTKQEYDDFLAKMPEALDWSKLQQYELEDATTGSQELACVAGGCEI